MKKISAFLLGMAVMPLAASAADYAPMAPEGVKYETCFVQTRTLRDYYGDKVTQLGNNGEFQVVSNRGGKIHCTITNKTVSGGNIANSRLDYRILVQHKGETEAEAQPLIFSKENGYIKWEQNEDFEPMEWLKNNFTDAYDVTVSLGGEDAPNYHVIYFYEDPETIERIGVQSRWERSKTVYESEITWVEPTTPDLSGALTWAQWEALEAEWQQDPSGVAMTSGSAEAAAEYFDLQGRRVDASTKGLLIRKARLSDGTVKVVKVVR